MATGTGVVMTAAMMLPAIAPVLLARASARSRAQALSFAATYFALWIGAGLIGAVASSICLSGAGSACVLALAAAYQLMPWKHACLARCRALGRPPERPESVAAALQAGRRYGLACLGCSWALMAALLAAGPMSTGWMAFFAALIAAERIAPARWALDRAVAGLVLVPVLAAVLSA